MLAGDYSSTVRKRCEPVYCCILLLCYITQEDRLWKTRKGGRSHKNIVWDTSSSLHLLLKATFPELTSFLWWTIAMYSQSLNGCQLKFLHRAPWLSVPPRQIRVAPTPHLEHCSRCWAVIFHICLCVHPRRKGEPGLLSSYFSQSGNIWRAEQFVGRSSLKEFGHDSDWLLSVGVTKDSFRDRKINRPIK